MQIANFWSAAAIPIHREDAALDFQSLIQSAVGVPTSRDSAGALQICIFQFSICNAVPRFSELPPSGL
jgi:hypothetical protein